MKVAPMKSQEDGISTMNLNTTVNVDPNFRRTLKEEEVKDFFDKFSRWNEIAYPIMNNKSYPYISLQDSLVNLVAPYSGESVLDDGCGDGTITVKLIEKRKKPLRFVVAVDPDLNILQEVPRKITEAGFEGKLALVQSSSMTPSILSDKSVDTILSGLGGIAYSGRYLKPSLNGNGPVQFTGRDALVKCLKERNRILETDGIIAFSSLVPDPDFDVIRRETILSALQKGEFGKVVELILNADLVQNISKFLKEYAQKELSQYLSIEDWKKVLSETGFELLDKDKAYADQGVVLVARKKEDR